MLTIRRKEMKLSVIIPFWKYKIFLDDCLNSLTLSNYQDFETILVLDQVEEDIEDLIETYQKKLDLKVVQSEKHGVAAARNIGLQNASGDYVYFLDSDDYVLEDTFELFADAMKTAPDKDIYAGTRKRTWYKRINFLEQDNAGKLERLDNIYNKKRNNFDKNFDAADVDENKKTVLLNLLLQSKNFSGISVLGHMYRTEFLKQHHIVFDERMTYYIDQPFNVEMVNHNPQIEECKNAYYIKRRHTDPYNTPALNGEDTDQRFVELASSYQSSLEKAESTLTKRVLEWQLCKYISSTLIVRMKRSNNPKWKGIVYSSLQPLVAQMDEDAYKKFGAYRRKCIELMKADDQAGMIKHVTKRLAKKRIKRLLKKRKLVEIYKVLYVHKYMKKPVSKNVILFESFFGKNYSDSPKYIYEYLAKNYPGKYEFVWALNNDTKLPYGGKKVKRFSKEYAYYLATAKYLVFNGRQPLWYRKREGQVFLETWHGTPLKKLVFDQEEVMAASPKYKMQVYQQREKWDYLVSANKFSTETFKRCFMYDKEILDYGYPRNDILYYENKDEIAIDLKKKLGIPLDKKTILYAPTWRDDQSYDVGKYKFELALDLARLKEEFGDEYVLLLRTHYFIADKIDVTGLEGFVYNLSDYDDIAEIYLISDICITDYSSVFFDFANLRRPILFYTYDLEKYRDQLRGFYISIEDDVPGPLLLTNDDVVEAIKNIDQITEEYQEKYDIFYDRFCTYDDGKASERIVKRVFGE